MVEGLEVGLRTWVEDGQGHQMEDDLGGRGQADGSLIGEDLAEAILSAAHRFSSDVREDDVTLIVLRRTA